MRYHSFFACLLLSALPAVAQTTSTRSDVQHSLGFEDQAAPSVTGWNSYPKGSVFADNQIVHSGKWSARLESTAESGKFTVISKVLPVDFRGGFVELRGFLRLRDIAGSAGLWLRLDADGEMLSLENMQSQQVNGTRDWAEYRVQLPINPKAQKLYFGVLISGTGILRADDLQLLLDGKPIAQAETAPPPQFLPEDHEFDTGSRITLTALNPLQVDNLVTLARVWGFLKYHHPAITSGQRHWDFELFRVLPAVLAAPDHAQANDAILAWIQKLGPIAACNPCLPAPSSDLDLRPDLNWIHDTGKLGAKLSTTLESIYASRSGRQFYVSPQEFTGNPYFEHELSYARISFPDSGYQLLALFRWWNILQYWSPDREVAGQNWAGVLADFIPQIALAKDKNALQLNLFKLIATANDTHANLWSSIFLRPPAGECSVPATFRFVGGKVAVYRTTEGSSSLLAGDVIDSVDQRPIAQLVSESSPYYADSNPAARQRDLAANLTRGACVPAQLEVLRGTQTLQLSVPRIRGYQMATHDLPGDTFRMLSPDIAYIKLSTTKAADLPACFARAKNTKGIIVDIRNYPSDFLPYALGAYLAARPTPFATFTAMDLSNPGAFFFGARVRIEPGSGHYSGKVAVLVDETTQSMAEFTTMALRAMPNTVVVGSTTAGADGNVSSIPLPGGLSTMISGLGVFYPDRRPTQRIGIVPDIFVEPTLAGLANQQDEVLEAAKRSIEAP